MQEGLNQYSNKVSSYLSASDHENHTRNMYLNTRGAKIHKFSNRVPYCVTSETQ